VEIPYATTEDLAELLMQDVADLPANSELLLELASSVVLEAAPRLADEAITEAPTARRLTLAMARRVIENPDGYNSETIGSYSYSLGSSSSGAAPAGLALSQDEYRALSPYRRTAGSLRTSTGPELVLDVEGA
jgi:hypothetical protein